MQVSESDFHIDGHQLYRTILNPPRSVPTRAVCLFSHGQGDYSERYKDVLHPFTEAGIRCILVDFLGHGMSSGRRGDCGSAQLLDQIIMSNLALTDGLPYGIAGHSMGGLLTLRHLSLAIEKKLPQPSFCWVNSPLLDPAHNKPDWFIRLALILAKVAPHTRISTGASPELCRTPELANPLEALSSGKMIAKPVQQNPLGHQKISIAWGAELIEISNYIYSVLLDAQCDIPFLFTQGDSDQICPHSVANLLFSQLDFSNKKMILFPNMKHETFAEPNREELFSALRLWIAELDSI